MQQKANFNCKCLVTDDVTNAQVGLSVIRLLVAISLKGQTLLNTYPCDLCDSEVGWLVTKVFDRILNQISQFIALSYVVLVIILKLFINIV